MGTVTLKTAPVLWIALVTIGQAAAVALVDEVSDMPAPLKGQEIFKPPLVSVVLILIGATNWPNAAATGSTLPLPLKNERLPKPA